MENKKITKKQKEIVCVIDRSGSMDHMRMDAIGGFNTFLEKQQKKEKNTLFTMVLFDSPMSENIVMYNGIKIKDVKPLTTETYIPRNGTALYDALGETIAKVEERHVAMENKPQVLFLILTDGEENSSKEYTQEKIKEKIEKLQKDSEWQFVYIGVTSDFILDKNMASISMGMGISGYSGVGISGFSGYTGIHDINVAFCSMSSLGESFIDSK